MEWKDYADFTAADFLTDDFFLEWVLHPDTENQAFWEEWQRLYPEKQPLIAEARAMLLSVEYRQDKLPAESYDRIWHALQKKMDHTIPETETVLTDMPVARRRWRRVALYTGVCSILALGIYWWIRPREKQELFTSQFGENRHLRLPDSSIVVLGPHSVLKATAFSDEDKTREIWLEGEAYFIIKKDPKARPFTVHSGDLDIEVLGTAFNVNNYSGNPRVVLHTGKVAVKDNRQGEKMRIIMEPGEMIEYRRNDNRYIRRKVVAEKYVAWVNNTLVFDNTSLAEVAEQLHDKYGIRLEFADSSLLQEHLNATLRQADHKVVLKAIQEAFGITIKQQDDNTFILSR